VKGLAIEVENMQPSLCDPLPGVKFLAPLGMTATLTLQIHPHLALRVCLPGIATGWSLEMIEMSDRYAVI
jgi:hypothetical protein